MNQKAEDFNTSPLNLFHSHNEGLGCQREKDALKTSGATKNGTR
jgi:hypothetical protein